MNRERWNDRGFILAAAILGMLVVGSAVAAGYFIANQEYRVGKALRESTSAFYAAQAGLERTYATWSIRDRWTMRAGDSVSVGPITLPNGTSYRGVAMRVDNVPQTDTDSERYYVVRVAGAAPAPLLGEEVRSSQAMVLRVRYYDFCCSAAIQVKDTLEQAGNSMISGNNLSPSAWAGQCDSANPANVAGAEVECDSCYSKGGVISQTYGNPPTESDTTLQSETLTEWDEINYDFLKAKASKTYAAGEIISNTVPVVTTDPLTGLPVCDESVRNNWGEPTNSLQPCFSYFPIIYAEGDLTINANRYGQGLLVVEGSLVIGGGYQFYGIVLVKGHLVSQGTGMKIYGSAVVAGQGPGIVVDSVYHTDSRVAGNSVVQYSACAVMRAKRFGELARKEPLPLRAWTETLN